MEKCFSLNTASDYFMSFRRRHLTIQFVVGMGPSTCLLGPILHNITKLQLFVQLYMYDFTILKNICFVGLKYQKYRCIKIYEVLFNKKTRTEQRYYVYVLCFLCVKIWMMRCYLILSICNYKTKRWIISFCFIISFFEQVFDRFFFKGVNR